MNANIRGAILMRFWNWILGITKAFGILSFFVAVIYIAYLGLVFVTALNAPRLVVSLINGGSGAQPSFDMGMGPNVVPIIPSRGVIMALNDHDSIVNWTLNCLNVDSVFQLQPKIAAQLFAPSFAPGYLPIGFGSETSYKNTRNLFPGEKSVVGLSKLLTAKRSYLDSQVENSYSRWQMWTIITVAIGMLTTIFISLSSTQFGREDGPSQKTIRTLAIVFPALGTAAAALFGFYGPQAEWGQATRSVATLSQLHTEMVMATLKIDCPTAARDTNDQALITLNEGWAKRFTDIDTISSSGGSSGNAPGTEKPTGPGGSTTTNTQGSTAQ